MTERGHPNRTGTVRTVYCVDCDVDVVVESVLDGAEDLCRRRDCYLRSPLARSRLCERLGAEVDRLIARDEAITEVMAQALEVRHG